MPKRGAPPLQGELIQGTLDMLILQTLVLGPAHGHTIAYAIEHRSDEVLQVEHGSLYPALHRLEDRRWISSFWGTSENNRKARYYRLTPAGRKQLAEQTGRWAQLVRAINRVLQPATRAIGMGMFYTLYYGAMMLGPVIAGAAAKWTGSAGAALDFGAAVLVACPLLLLVFNRAATPRPPSV